MFFRCQSHSRLSPRPRGRTFRACSLLDRAQSYPCTASNLCCKSDQRSYRLSSSALFRW
jgi:hypothetical protein